MQDTAKMMQEWQNQAQAALKTYDTPEKQGEWLKTWSDGWKSQFENGSTNAHPATGAAPAGPAPEQSASQLDELTNRITQLEGRVALLEKELKNRS